MMHPSSNNNGALLKKSSSAAAVAVWSKKMAARGYLSLPQGYQPSEIDIVCGRGRGCYNSPGNILFRRVVNDFVEPYMNLPSKTCKTAMLHQIVGYIQQTYHSKFLQEKGGVWFELNFLMARRKVGNAMREAVNAYHHNISQDHHHETNSTRRTPAVVKVSLQEHAHEPEQFISEPRRGTRSRSTSPAAWRDDDSPLLCCASVDSTEMLNAASIILDVCDDDDVSFSSSSNLPQRTPTNCNSAATTIFGRQVGFSTNADIYQRHSLVMTITHRKENKEEPLGDCVDDADAISCSFARI